MRHRGFTTSVILERWHGRISAGLWMLCYLRLNKRHAEPGCSHDLPATTPTMYISRGVSRRGICRDMTATAGQSQHGQERPVGFSSNIIFPRSNCSACLRPLHDGLRVQGMRQTRAGKANPLGHHSLVILLRWPAKPQTFNVSNSCAGSTWSSECTGSILAPSAGKACRSRIWDA